MSDVFLSYASEDRERARRLAKALGHMGWSVWWDRKIIAGQASGEAIDRELEGARSVVVLWSVNSIASEWVKNEAAAASERGVLVPALIDNVKLPLAFRHQQAADLRSWQGNGLHPGFQALCQGVAHAMGGAVRAPRRRLVVHPAKKRPRWAVPALAALIVALGLGLGLRLYAAGPWRPAAPTSPMALAPGLTDLVVGTYSGDVMADSKGPSRNDISVTDHRDRPRCRACGV